MQPGTRILTYYGNFVTIKVWASWGLKMWGLLTRKQLLHFNQLFFNRLRDLPGKFFGQLKENTVCYALRHTISFSGNNAMKNGKNPTHFQEAKAKYPVSPPLPRKIGEPKWP